MQTSINVALYGSDILPQDAAYNTDYLALPTPPKFIERRYFLFGS